MQQQIEPEGEPFANYTLFDEVDWQPFELSDARQGEFGRSWRSYTSHSASPRMASPLGPARWSRPARHVTQPRHAWFGRWPRMRRRGSWWLTPWYQTYSAGAVVYPEEQTEYVRWVQNSLSQLLGLNIPVSGVLDHATRRAIRHFQRQAGLPVDGIVGPATQSALLSAVGGQQRQPPFQASAVAGAAQDDTGFAGETGKINLRQQALPASIVRALQRGFEPLALRLAIRWGLRDENKLTNMIFFARHPRLQGQPLSRNARDFKRRSSEWAAIRSQLVRPALQARSSVRSDSAGGLARGLAQRSGITSPLPAAGPGFYSYVGNDRRYGHPETIRALQAIGAAWARMYPSGPLIGIGDISFNGGGKMPPHKSHQDGFDVDIRPMRQDGARRAVVFQDPGYAQARTQDLVNAIISNGVLRVKYIFFNDPAITGVRPLQGHDNHLHVRFYPPSSSSLQNEVNHQGRRNDSVALRRREEGEVGQQSIEYTRWVQQALNRILGTPLVRDGRLGPKTRSAIRSFQARQGLLVDGIIGPQTERALIAAGAGPPPSTTSISTHMNLQALRNRIVHLANQEWNRWGRGTIKEADPLIRPVLEEYWRTGTGIQHHSPSWWSEHPWSAAFISWVMRQAGATAFPRSSAHALYIKAAKDNRIAGNNNPFKAYRITEVRPQPGDLVCKSRAGSGATYDTIRPGMKTHCDIVTEVQPGKLTTIGGNVSDSVRKTPVRTDANGFITEPGYFAVIKLG